MAIPKLAVSDTCRSHPRKTINPISRNGWVWVLMGTYTGSTDTLVGPAMHTKFGGGTHPSHSIDLELGPPPQNA